MNRGYVKVWRKIEDSGLIQLPNTLALFMHLLLNASHKDRKIGTPNGVVELKRGQYISGRIELASRLKQSEREIRTGLSRLNELSIISIKSTNRFSVYTIENYGIYQDNDQHSDQPATNKRPSGDQPATTKQEFNNGSIEELNKNIVGNKLPTCPHEDILNLYAQNLPMLAQVKVWSDKRKALLRARWNEDEKRQNLQWWGKYFNYISKSDFLTGKKTSWQADIEWVLNPTNLIKIIEGTYDNKETQ